MSCRRLERLDTTSSQVESFNEASQSKLEQSSQLLQEHTRVLQTAQADLHAIFRRIR